MPAAYRFRTKPFAHQKKLHRILRGRKYFALLGEQGTGKTKSCIDDCAQLYEEEEIDALLVVGPNEGDVPDNWLDQLKQHLPSRIAYSAVRLRSQGMLVKQKQLFEALVSATPWLGRPTHFRVITTNIEVLRSGSPLFNKLLSFCRNWRVLMIVDESTRIKSPSAAQTRGALKLGANAEYRRISTGTLSPNGPFDVYSQMLFLDRSILGFESFTVFKACYCQMLPPEHGLVRHTADKMASRIRNPTQAEAFRKKMISIIQLPARDPTGAIMYRNQEDLSKRIAPYSFRVLKKDCLDLPPKLYVKRYIELTPQQRAIYDLVRKKVIAEFVKDKELHRITVPLMITRLLRLQQITCNHFTEDPDPDNPVNPPKRIELAGRDKKHRLVVTNPRLLDLLAVIDEAGEGAKGIIYCAHHPEIREIAETLSDLYGPAKVSQLHGDVSSKDRAAARKDFQKLDGKVQWIIIQVRSGIGIDLFEASWEYFYSNSYSLEDRLQCEDRAHRYGLKHNLTVFDVIARNTLNEKTINMLRNKKLISDVIVQDPLADWI